MWARYSLKDFRIIAHYLGIVVCFTSFIFLIPVVVAIVFQEYEPISRYLGCAGLTFLLGTCLLLVNVSPPKINRHQALAVTGFSWIIVPVLVAIPLYFSGHYYNFLNALFDGISSITTTNASTVADLDHLSYADNVLRYIVQVYGGLGLVLVVLAFGFMKHSEAGSSLYSSEARAGLVVSNVYSTSKIILRMVFIGILIGTIFLGLNFLLLGMTPQRSVLHALCLSCSALVSGGFAPMSQNVTYYHSINLEMMLIILMVISSISFVLLAKMLKGRFAIFSGDLEIKGLVVWVLIMTVIFAFNMCASGSETGIDVHIRRGVFMLFSAFTTTGFQNITNEQIVTYFTSGGLMILVILMAVGGCANSTSGGFKFYRLGIIYKALVQSIKEIISPSSSKVKTSFRHVTRQEVTVEAIKQVFVVFMFYLITYIIGFLVGIAYGYDAINCIFDSVAITSNGGIVTLVSPTIPVGLEITYMIQMLLGRLEFMTLIALLAKLIVSLNPKYWRKSTTGKIKDSVEKKVSKLKPKTHLVKKDRSA